MFDIPKPQIWHSRERSAFVHKEGITQKGQCQAFAFKRKQFPELCVPSDHSWRKGVNKMVYPRRLHMYFNTFACWYMVSISISKVLCTRLYQSLVSHVLMCHSSRKMHHLNATPLITFLDASLLMCLSLLPQEHCSIGCLRPFPQGHVVSLVLIQNSIPAKVLYLVVLSLILFC